MSIVFAKFVDDKVAAVVYTPIDDPSFMAVDSERADIVAFLDDLTGLKTRFAPLNPVRFALGMLYLNITPDMVHDAIYALPEPDKTIAAIYWERADKFLRDDPILAAVSAGFDLTDQQIDEAWRYAEQLT
ncbi:hypothetical protein [Rhizobium phage RHph_I40]|nr:hypothetical protein [Rhizobium phage RHph_I40]